jgi:hypothetical protein
MERSKIKPMAATNAKRLATGAKQQPRRPGSRWDWRQRGGAVELNTRIAAIARERGWNPCRLSSDQRLALMREVLDSLPRPVPPESAQPKPPTPSERHAQDLLEQAHAAAGGTGEYSEGTPGIGAARFDHPRHGW